MKRQHLNVVHLLTTFSNTLSTLKRLLTNNVLIMCQVSIKCCSKGISEGVLQTTELYTKKYIAPIALF